MLSETIRNLVAVLVKDWRRYHRALTGERSLYLQLCNRYERLEAALEHMTDATVSSVEPLAIAGVELLHHPRQRHRVGLQHKMEVIRHQTTGPASNLKARARDRQPKEKPLIVAVIQENLLACITARHDVVHRTGDMHAQWSSHAHSNRKSRTTSNRYSVGHGFLRKPADRGAIAGGIG